MMQSRDAPSILMLTSAQSLAVHAAGVPHHLDDRLLRWRQPGQCGADRSTAARLDSTPRQWHG